MKNSEDIRIISASLKLGEGKERKKIVRITRLVDNQANVRLLDVRFREEENYTVIKIAGFPNELFSLLMEMAEQVYTSFNFRNYQSNARVVGLFSHLTISPVRNITLPECEQMAGEFAREFSQQFQLPVIFVGNEWDDEKAGQIFRSDQKFIRNALEKGEVTPVLEDIPWSAEKGAMLIRVRKYIVYLAIVLNHARLEIAQNLADDLSFRGRVLLDKNGNPRKDKDGRVMRARGRFKTVDATAYSFGSGEQAQVIFSLKDYENPTILKLFNTALELCQEELIEIVGTRFLLPIPLQVIQVAMKEISKIHQKQSLSDVQQIQFIREYMKLDELGEFLPEYHIIDYYFLPYPG